MKQIFFVLAVAFHLSVAGALTCEQFNALPAAQKQRLMLQKHRESAQDTQSLLVQDSEALAAILKFLVPGKNENHGFETLSHTLTMRCDFFAEPTVKMVHAIGTMAAAHMKVYPQLQKLDSNGKPVGTLPNPWTGLLSPSAKSVPMMVRFSIANPVGPTLDIDGKRLLLEFIPGIGLKFFIDGQKSVDLLAMESLAGQGTDHNVFKYDFSPDFSKHAPSDYTTATGPEKDEILARYNQNPVNNYVMNLVGKRFSQAIQYALGIDPAPTQHSITGPHGFIISVQPLAAVDQLGNKISEARQKRPWRLVFRPAVDTWSPDRRAHIADSSPGTDFRAKLANLVGGDTIYYVEGETRAGERYRLGEIVLDSGVFPSSFADRQFFLQHELELNRIPGRDSAILDP